MTIRKYQRPPTSGARTEFGDSQITTGVAGVLCSEGEAADAWQSLFDHLQDFTRMTAAWPEFKEQAFPQRSIGRALEFFADVWNRADSHGKAALAEAFCGPSEDGAVNCQWKRESRFLGMSFPADGPIDAYFNDSATGEEHEGPADAEMVAHWLERL